MKNDWTKYGNRFIAAFLCASIATISLWSADGRAATPAINATPATDAAQQQALSRVENNLTFIESLRSTVDRSQFDLEALIDNLDWEVDSVVRFVQSEISFEQYPGALRGALGTLLSRSGNSLDQALLLATLIRDAGADVRIIRGRLTEADARRLLTGMGNKPDALPPADKAKWNALAGAQSESTPADTPAAASAPASSGDGKLQQALNIADALTELLENHGEVHGVAASTILEEARDYFWVEIRTQDAGSWQAVHPAFGDASVVVQPQVKTTYTASIPEALLHKFRVGVFLERRELGTLKVEQVMPDWQRPVANMLGRSFTYFTQPNLVDEKSIKEGVSQSIAQSSLFVPVFNNAVQPGTQGFGLDGVTVDLDIVGGGVSGAPGFFKTLGEATDKATAALDGLGSDKPAAKRARYLTALWIQYTLVDPDGKETTARRYLLDRVGATVRANGDAKKLTLVRAEPWQLLGSDEIVLAAGRYPAALTLDEILARNHAAVGLQSKFGQNGKLTAKDYSEVGQRTRGNTTAVLLRLLQQFDTGMESQQSAATYRSAPTLLALHWAPVTASSGRFSTDIVSHERRSTAWQDERNAAADLRLQGVWETVQEGNALGMLELPIGEVESAASGFIGKDNSRLPKALSLVRSQAELDATPLFADHKQLLRQALQEGYFVVLTERDISSPFSWWRVNPSSGAVLGMLADGRGATATEYIIGLTLVAVGVLAVLAVREALECEFENTMQGGNGRPVECCFIDEITEDGSLAESLVYDWALATVYMKSKVGMAREWCEGEQPNP